MNYKKKASLLLVLSLTITSLALLLEWLPHGYVSFGYKLEIALIEPLYMFGIATSLSLFILFFLSNRIFKKWLAFNLWYLPLVIVVISFSPYVGDMQMFWGKRDLAQFFATLHVFISLFIFFKHGRHSPNQKS